MQVGNTYYSVCTVKKHSLLIEEGKDLLLKEGEGLKSNNNVSIHCQKS